MLARSVLSVSLVVLAASPEAESGPGRYGPAATPRVVAAAGPGSLPGRFVVRGAPLARRGKATAGRSISVYVRPPAVVVDGCRSRAVRVRTRGRRASLSALARCPSTRSQLRIRAQITGGTMRGTAGRRRFTARLRPPKGKLLPGRRSARAVGAVRNVDALAPHADSEFSEAGRGREIARTEIVLRLKRDATVGQVNAALDSVGGRIAGSIAGSRRVIVAIPDTGSLAVLNRLLAQLAKRPGVDDAIESERAAGQELPPAFGSPPSASQRAELSHLIAMRMPAAWNARRAAKQANRPTLLVADEFGNGPPTSQVDGPIDPSDFLTSRPNAHGYHVLGIVAAKFANNGTPAGRVTGVFPARARLKVMDLTGATIDGAANQVFNAVRAESGRVVVNTSLGHNPVTIDRYARQEGSDWAERLRDAGLAPRLLHVGSAGNSAAAADRNGFWVSAALRNDLADIDGFPLQPIQQTLAVENLVDTGSPAYEPGCLAITSNRGGNLAAVGTNVFSFRLGTTAGNDSGTSQAAPQAAGLAEYMWTIAPDLTAPQLKAAIVATAAPSLGSGPPCGTDLPSSPRLDAYAAVLSLDEAGAATPAGSPVRLALLDRTGDGAFTEADLQTWVSSLPAADPPARTWSRSDLNGDGFAGGAGTAPFDLARAGSTRGGLPNLANPISQAIESASVAFNENAVTDMQIVCFYAYSGLYTGNTDQRKSVLDPVQRCGATVEPPESENCTATTAFGQAATIMGTSGNDVIEGTSGPDVILGGAGDDFIGGMEGDDRICSGPGKDHVAGGLAAADSDDPDGFGPLPPIDSGDDLLDGGPDNDRVTGTGGDDRVFGGDGQDSVLGGSPGSDFMDGGPGDGDVCSRAEIPRDGGAGGPDSFGPGCEFINNF